MGKLSLRICALATLALAACNAGGHPSGGAPQGWTYDATGVQSLRLNGHEFSARGLYIIGSCTGADQANVTVQSTGSDGHVLASGVGCAGAPFALSITPAPGGALNVDVSVGPLPRAYATLSIPTDLRKVDAQTFTFDATPSFWWGCNGSVTKVQGDTGLYAQIPLLCPLPPLGAVGYADPIAPVSTVASGPAGHVRVTVIDPGDLRDCIALNHPSTNNIECSFGARPTGASVHAKLQLSLY